MISALNLQKLHSLSEAKQDLKLLIRWRWSEIKAKFMYLSHPAKMNLQDRARILHARLAWHVHAICPFSCTILAQSCTYLARSCTYLARNGARFCKRCCKNNYRSFLHIFLQDLARIGARLCENRSRKGTYRVHVPSKSCMQDSCTILHDLASSFLLGMHCHSRSIGNKDSESIKDITARGLLNYPPNQFLRQNPDSYCACTYREKRSSRNTYMQWQM